MSTYADFQDQNTSEKLILAKINASERLIGFEVHSGSVYKISRDIAKINSVEDSGVGLTEVFGLTDVVPGSFYNDRVNKIIYLETSGSTNPNGSFLAVNFENYFANAPVHLANDPGVGSGFEVEWLPLITKISGFGVKLDQDDQIGFALEGSGAITFALDREYFDTRYEGIIWENQDVEIYSWTRGLPASEAKVIFRGGVNSKTYGKTVQFRLKDKIEQLRRPFPSVDISTVSDALVPDGLLTAKKRVVYGRLNGFRPTNIDQVVDGYLLTGTLSVTAGSATVTGAGTSFLSKVSPGDVLLINDAEFTVESVATDTSLDMSEVFGFDLTGEPVVIVPDQPKDYINREWIVARHACHQPALTITNSVTSNKFTLSSTDDIEVGDKIFVGASGTGELVTISEIFGGGLVKTTETLLAAPANGTAVIRPCIQNAKINGTEIRFDRDFTISISSTETRLILDEEAEKNIRPIRTLNGTVDFTITSRSVTGSGTSFESQLRPGQYIRAKGQVAFFQILSIESNTALTLVEASTYTDTGGPGQFRGGFNFDPNEDDVLSCTVLGKTDDGTKDGALLKRAGEIVEDVLGESGITGLNSSAFSLSNEQAPYTLGFAIPSNFEESSAETVRDIINKVNTSVFGSLVQNEDFELEYNILRPNRPPNAEKINEDDVLENTLKVVSNNDRVVEKVFVQYDNKEYDPSYEDSSFLTFEKTSDIGQYLVKNKKEKTVDTVLVYEDDARILANRWSFLLSIATNTISFKTKLQAARFQVNDVIVVEHNKLFERLGGGKRKYAAVSKIIKTEGLVEIECDDLANAFNRVCIITENDVPVFSSSNDEQKAQNGFITDTFGLIENENFGLNVIW